MGPPGKKDGIEYKGIRSIGTSRLNGKNHRWHSKESITELNTAAKIVLKKDFLPRTEKMGMESSGQDTKQMDFQILKENHLRSFLLLEKKSIQTC